MMLQLIVLSLIHLMPLASSWEFTLFLAPSDGFHPSDCTTPSAAVPNPAYGSGTECVVIFNATGDGKQMSMRVTNQVVFYQDAYCSELSARYEKPSSASKCTSGFLRYNHSQNLSNVGIKLDEAAAVPPGFTTITAAPTTTTTTTTTTTKLTTPTTTVLQNDHHASWKTYTVTFFSDPQCTQPNYFYPDSVALPKHGCGAVLSAIPGFDLYFHLPNGAHLADAYDDAACSVGGPVGGSTGGTVLNIWDATCQLASQGNYAKVYLGHDPPGVVITTTPHQATTTTTTTVQHTFATPPAPGSFKTPPPAGVAVPNATISHATPTPMAIPTTMAGVPPGYATPPPSAGLMATPGKHFFVPTMMGPVMAGPTPMGFAVPTTMFPVVVAHKKHQTPVTSMMPVMLETLPAGHPPVPTSLAPLMVGPGHHVDAPAVGAVAASAGSTTMIPTTSSMTTMTLTTTSTTTTTSEMPWGLPWWAWFLICCGILLLCALFFLPICGAPLAMGGKKTSKASATTTETIYEVVDEPDDIQPTGSAAMPMATAGFPMSASSVPMAPAAYPMSTVAPMASAYPYSAY
mmetsp:Transcript_61701/g.147218  ORF Transcript_61701/g.147218 Transcript_61701/m.147218 type:complete len:572 (-) Transcript_61701:230-1945(-)